MRTRLLHIALALLALLLTLEGGLRLLPVSSATLVADHLKQGIPSYPPGHRWTVSTGWDLRNAQRLQANAQGFSASRNFRPDSQAVALIGDSFVEASMLPAEARLESQLGARLRAPVYAMGSPGSSLLDYGHRLLWAQREFQVGQAVLLLEPGDVRQSFCGSGNHQSLCLEPGSLALRTVQTPEPGALKRVLRHSALAQYMFSQLKLNAATLWANVRKQAQPAPDHAGTLQRSGVPTNATQGASELERVELVAAHFLRQVGNFKGHLLIVMDADRAALRRGEAGSDKVREHFMALLRAQGIRVVDLAPVFMQHLRRSDRALEVGPYDTHLNQVGLSLVAQSAADALR